MECGRIRKPLQEGYTALVDGNLRRMETGALRLQAGQSYELDTAGREYALVLVKGNCRFKAGEREECAFGPRRDPFRDLAYAALIPKQEKVVLTAVEDSLLAVAHAEAAEVYPLQVITPDQVRAVKRGAANWQREVRFVLWSDNTTGNMLVVGETVTPSGNWSTIPPHRHQYDIPGEEVAYEEAYFFQFSKPQGYALAWQFDDEGEMDQAFSLRSNDSLFIGKGYHPTACGPGADLYHVTFIAGPKRQSKASIHPDFQFMLEEEKMANPFQNQ